MGIYGAYNPPWMKVFGNRRNHVSTDQRFKASNSLILPVPFPNLMEGSVAGAGCTFCASCTGCAGCAGCAVWTGSPVSPATVSVCSVLRKAPAICFEFWVKMKVKFYEAMFFSCRFKSCREGRQSTNVKRMSRAKYSWMVLHPAFQMWSRLGLDWPAHLPRFQPL